MVNNPMTRAPKRRWIVYWPRTLIVLVAFLLIAAGSTVGYWFARQVAFERATGAYDRALAAWEAETLTTAELCKASREVFDAEVAIPFARWGRAASAYLERIDGMRQKIYAYDQIGDYMSEKARQKTLSEINDYYAEAEDLVAHGRRSPSQ